MRWVEVATERRPSGACSPSSAVKTDPALGDEPREVGVRRHRTSSGWGSGSDTADVGGGR